MERGGPGGVSHHRHRPAPLLYHCAHFSQCPPVLSHGSSADPGGHDVLYPGRGMSMTPMGERIGTCLTRSRNLPVIVAVAFLLGFIVTISEPDLQVLAGQVPAVPNMTLILSVACGVGAFLVIALLRMLFSMALPPLLVVCYAVVFVLAALCQRIF